MNRLPNYITFAWQRSDGDYEVVGTLNGETIDDDSLWNTLVAMTLSTLRQSDNDTRAYHREDVVSVLIPDEGEDWTPIKIGGAT